jgi:hypothetical protein
MPMLNFGDRTRTGVSNMVWSLASLSSGFMQSPFLLLSASLMLVLLTYIAAYCLGYGLVDWGSIPGRSWDLFFPPPSRPTLGPTHPPIQRVPGVKWPGLKLTAHLNPVPRLRMRGAIPPFAQYVFMTSDEVKRRDNFTFIPLPRPGKYKVTQISPFDNERSYRRSQFRSGCWVATGFLVFSLYRDTWCYSKVTGM